MPRCRARGPLVRQRVARFETGLGLGVGRVLVRDAVHRHRDDPEAVRLVRESGKALAQIAKDLGVSEPSLRTWRKQTELDNGKRSDGLTTEEHAEVRRLRRENRILREEREILRKAAAFLARETTR